MYAALGIPTWAILVASLCAACAFDAVKRRVPNWLTVGMLGAGLAARGLDAGLWAAGWGMLGALTGLAVMWVPFARGWVGGGDAKLLTAIGGWLGPVATLEAALAAGVAGGLLALGHLVGAGAGQRRRILSNLRMAVLMRVAPEPEARERHDKLPYSLALAAGAVVAVALHRGPFGLG